MGTLRVKSMLAGAMIAGTVLAVPVAANASLSQCAVNYTCLWGNNDFLWYLAGKNQNQGYSNLTGEANDQMDSWANRSVLFNSCGREHSNGAGDSQTWNKNSSDNDVNTFNSDEVSSYKTNGSC